LKLSSDKEKSINSSNAVKTHNQEEAYNTWKKELQELSGLDDTMFNKQILILMQACNRCFDDNSRYSKDLLYTLNYKIDKDNSKKPIIFDILKIDKASSVSTGIYGITEKDKKIANDKATQNAYIANLDAEQSQKLDMLTENDLELKEPEMSLEEYEAKYNTMHDEETKDVVDKSVDKMKLFVQFSVFMILALIFGSVIYIILTIFWEYIAKIFNIVVYSLMQLIYSMKNIGGKYHATTYYKDMIKAQQDFIKTKIHNDAINYQLYPTKSKNVG